jgi:hypothetical protein
MNISTIITVLFAGIFIAFVLLVYIRNRQGDQRMIQTTNNMLLPLLTIITITLGSIFSFHTGNLACTNGIPNIVRYIAILGATLLIIVGVIRYFLHQHRDRLLIMQPMLLAIVLVIIAFLIEHLAGCL